MNERKRVDIIEPNPFRKGQHVALLLLFNVIGVFCFIERTIK